MQVNQPNENRIGQSQTLSDHRLLVYLDYLLDLCCSGVQTIDTKAFQKLGVGIDLPVQITRYNKFWRAEDVMRRDILGPAVPLVALTQRHTLLE